MTQRPGYEHTQQGWPMRLSFGLGALVMLVLAAAPLPEISRVPVWALLAGAALLLTAGWCFSSLTVRIGGDRITLHFGFGWPSKSVSLAEVASASVTRTTFCEGWGVHRTRRGWLYNVSGFDAVIVQRRDGSSLLIGSDEARRLKAAIERALGRG
ncbi:MAG TPA: hypothetical protein VMK32_06765 [Burkholderiaceae bacterium]|nr:hypothetical protein [Burkholderiaceae bacterium]